jgi:hypothetical protein
MENMRQITGLAIEVFAKRIHARESRHQSLIPRENPFRMTLRAAVRRTALKKLSIHLSSVFAAILLAACAVAQDAPPAPNSPPAETPAPQAPIYQPKFAGDPARSDSEAAALAYMRVVLRAQRQFNKQYNHFAVTLAELVHSGSFTKRMVNPVRGDYTASFKGKTDSFILTMTPKALDAQHRSLYAEDDMKIHADENKPADGDSPVVK